MGSGFAAGAGADALRQVLAEKRLEQLQSAEGQRLLAQDEENTRRWNVGNERATANDRSVAETRSADVARDQAAAENAATRQQEQQQGLDNLIRNPQALAGMNPIQRLLTLKQYGVGNVGVHDVEDAEQHQAHLTADDTRKRDAGFSDWQKRYDYGNANPRPQRPQRIVGARVLQDDPALPLGSQRYITQIASKHGGDFNAARAELDTYLGSPGTTRDHPRLNPLKAHEALRKMHARPSGAGAGDELDDLIAQAMGGGMGGNVGGQQGGATRIAGPSPAPGADAQLADRARQVLEQGGFAATPENVQRFLSNPQNRARLTGGQ